MGAYSAFPNALAGFRVNGKGKWKGLVRERERKGKERNGRERDGKWNLAGVRVIGFMGQTPWRDAVTVTSTSRPIINCQAMKQNI